MQSIFGGVLLAIEDIIDWISSTANTVQGLFADIDFTVLYDWLPADIVSVITAVLLVLFALAIFGLLRRLLFFMG